MRVALLALFVVATVALMAVLAYRAVLASARARQRELAERSRERSADELYTAGEIDVLEYERLLEAELRHGPDAWPDS